MKARPTTTTMTTTTARDGGRVNEELFDAAQDSLLDLVDNLLNRGVVVRGDVVLGVAGVDLVYLQLNALLCAADRLLPEAQQRRPKRRQKKARP